MHPCRGRISLIFVFCRVYDSFSKGEDTETLNLSDGSEVDAWTAFADLDDGIWEVYISGEKSQNGSVIKRITTEAQLLEVRKEGDAGYDLCPSLIQ